MELIIIVVGVVLLIVLANVFSKNQKQSREERVEALKKEREEARIAKEEKEKKDKEDYDALVAKYGEPERIIKRGDTIENWLIVFPSAELLYVNGEAHPFSTILDCTIKDEAHERTSGEKQVITKTNTGSTIGRAIVGSVVAGPAGAIIGGATAKKNTTIVDNTKKSTTHNYYAVITFSDAANPLIRIKCAWLERAEEIKAIVMGIIAKRQPSEPTVNTPSVANELRKLAQLKQEGIITQEEFDSQKRKLLS